MLNGIFNSNEHTKHFAYNVVYINIVMEILKYTYTQIVREKQIIIIADNIKSEG